MQVTLTANSQTNPPNDYLRVLPGQSASYSIAVTGTITVTLNRKVAGSSAIAADTAYTASTSKQIIAPGDYQLIASGVSGGSAITEISLD